MKKIVLAIVLVVFAGYALHGLKKYRDEVETVESYNKVVETFNECLAAFDWKCAEENLRVLYKEAPEDTNLQLNMVAVLLEEEKYEECILFVNEQARPSANLENLKEKAILLQREMEELHLEKSFHFRLEYDGSPTRQNVMEALAVLEVAYDSISRLFQFDPPNKLSVVLYQANEHTGVGQRPDWVGAIYDGKLRVPENVMEYSGVYRPMLFHELTHAFVRGMTHGNIPQWLNEGIAQVVDGSRTGMEKPAGPAPTLKDLTDSFVNEGDRSVAERLYWYSQKMVEGMLRRNGSFEHFKKFVQELNRIGEGDALKKYYGVTAEQLLDEVR